MVGLFLRRPEGIPARRDVARRRSTAGGGWPRARGTSAEDARLPSDRGCAEQPLSAGWGSRLGGVAHDRITTDPEVMGGVATIRGLRIPVATVVSMVADGMTVEEICTDLPDLTADDVSDALRYAADALRERVIPLRSSA